MRADEKKQVSINTFVVRGGHLDSVRVPLLRCEVLEEEHRRQLAHHQKRAVAVRHDSLPQHVPHRDALPEVLVGAGEERERVLLRFEPVVHHLALPLPSLLRVALELPHHLGFRV